MRQVTRYFILCYGLLETFVFTGSIFGWTALLYMLRQEGIYSHLCDNLGVENITRSSVDALNNFFTTTTLPSVEDVQIDTLEHYDDLYVLEIEYAPKTCDSQSKLLNLAFTIGSFCLGSTAFIWGFLLEKWGLRCVRLIINGILTVGTLLLSQASETSSYLIFPALILICLAGIPLRLANMQIADLFPKYRSTIITLYSGGFSASASVFVFIKYGYDAGLHWEWACFILVALSIVMLPVTLFLLPSDRIEEPQGSIRKTKKLSKRVSIVNEVAGISPSVWGTFVLVEDGDTPITNPAVSIINSSGAIREKPPVNGHNNENGVHVPCVTKVPLKESLFSISYMMHQYWFSWLLLHTIIFVGTLSMWSDRTSDDPELGVFFAKLYGLFQIFGLFLAPIGGAFMDWRIQMASKEQNAEFRRLRVLQSNFWPITVTTIMAVIAQAAKYYNSPEAIWIAVIFVTLFRTFLLSIGTAYLRIRFPANHFPQLLGIMSTTSAFITLLQFPLFLWEGGAVENVLHVNIFDSVCLAMACIHPVMILFTPLQKYFISKEKELAKKREALNYDKVIIKN